MWLVLALACSKTPVTTPPPASPAPAAAPASPAPAAAPASAGHVHVTLVQTGEVDRRPVLLDAQGDVACAADGDGFVARAAGTDPTWSLQTSWRATKPEHADDRDMLVVTVGDRTWWSLPIDARPDASGRIALTDEPVGPKWGFPTAAVTVDLVCPPSPSP